MEIFGKHIYGCSVKEWIDLPYEDKINWIKKYTNQQSDEAINEFINTPFNIDDCGCGCGGNKTKTNVTSGIPKTITNSTETTEATGDSSGTDAKRRTKRKTAKGSGL